MYFYTLELEKWPWKNKQNAHQCCNAWVGLQSTWKHIFQVCEIPFRYLYESCEYCMSTAAEFFFQVPWNLLLFCCKSQYFTVARHLTLSALSSCPFTCIHLFFPSILQSGINLITVNMPRAVNGYRHQGVKEGKMNFSLQSEIDKMMISREWDKKTCELGSQGKQHHNSKTPSAHKQRKGFLNWPTQVTPWKPSQWGKDAQKAHQKPPSK